VSDQVDRNENLIEVLKRNGDFSKNYGPWLGALLLWLAMKSARPKSPPWWAAVIATVGTVGGLAWRYGIPGVTG
jgi:hypothetical protein